MSNGMRWSEEPKRSAMVSQSWRMTLNSEELWLQWTVPSAPSGRGRTRHNAASCQMTKKHIGEDIHEERVQQGAYDAYEKERRQCSRRIEAPRSRWE